MHSACNHTFVICAYKDNPYLEKAVQSIKGQSELGSAFIATSTPNDHISDIAVRYDLEVVVNHGESSIARDWNYGFDAAGTDLVTIVHQDDYYEPNYLERVLHALNSAKEQVGVVHTDYYEIRDGSRVDDNRLLKIKRMMNRAFARGMLSGSQSSKRRGLAFGDAICCPSVTFDKRIVGDSVFDVRYANSCDYRTWVNLVNQDIPFLYVPERLMGHRIYSESTTSQNISSDIRSTEDYEVLASLWPKPIARMIFTGYAQSQKSNDV